MIRGRAPQAGLSIIELMIAMALGLVIVTALVMVFANSSNTQQEVRRNLQQIENGRYAMDVLVQDLQTAGYFGSFRKLTPGAAPDPCSVALADLQSAISIPIQAYNAATLTAVPALPPSCNAFLPAANLSPGSDVVVIRRSDTQIVPIGTTTDVGGIYTQVNPSMIEVQLGGGTTTCTSKANGSVATISRRCEYPAAVDICAATCPAQPAGYVRQLHVHIYFVSPCNVPVGANCTSAADNGRPIPTLKRLELAAVGGVTSFQVSAIAEGVEFLKLGYGIDDTPAAVNSDTGLIGDGSPDRYVLAPTLSELSNLVTARVDLLVRSPEASVGFTDSKTYQLGINPVLPTSSAVSIPASGLDTSFRRHVYSAEARLVNMSSRKEIP